MKCAQKMLFISNSLDKTNDFYYLCTRNAIVCILTNIGLPFGFLHTKDAKRIDN